MATPRRLLLATAALLLAPASALAHTGAGLGHALGDGLAHPLAGADHLLAMLAVGIWTAQQRGRASLAIPAAFLAAMGLGGLAGASALPLPAVAPMIALSLAVFGGLAVARARLGAVPVALLAGGFASFHGFAHGSELPPAASFASFGTGFLVASAALQGMGWLLARAFVALLAALLSGQAAFGQARTGSPTPPASAQTEPPEGVEEIVIEGRGAGALDARDSASEGRIGAEQLALRPLLRPGELLEAVPGVVLTQHSGGGKANQIFLRGFNLDHGTDFATSIDGVPLNLPSHGHGQGYTDLNPLIPELVERVHFRKGPYYAELGDFASAGAAEIELFDRLDRSLARVEVGRFGHQRGVAASSLPLSGGDLLYAGEILHADGPWKEPDDFVRGVGVLRYSRGSAARGFRATAMAYEGRWDSSDQIAESAIPAIGRLGSLDDTTGGESRRHGLSAEWWRRGAAGEARILGYGFYSDLDLFSNFTYFLGDPALGDQFEQRDRRLGAGLDARRSWIREAFGFASETALGLQLRNDAVRNALLGTRERVPVDKQSGPATIRSDRILQTSLAPFVSSETRWLDWLRSEVGVRVDAYRFEVDDRRDLNSGTRWDAIASPKGSLVLGPWLDTALYLQGGGGFHSNDARGVVQRADPISLAPVARADPLVRTRGAELGLRSARIPGLESTLALWWLDLASELVFVGDAGTTEASRPSRRFGLELAGDWTPLDWLGLDAQLSLSRARFRDRDTGEGNRVPGAIESVVAAGIRAHGWHGLGASLRLRYFGPRPLSEDGRVRSDPTLLLSAALAFEFWRHWTLSAEAFNLLDRRDNDIEYFYESAIAPGAAPAEQKHVHPVEPLSLRIGLGARF